MRLAVAALALSFVLPVACDSPSPRFSGADRREVTVGGSRFAVYRRGGEAEAVRTSTELRPGRRETVLKGLVAIEAATGCAVRPRRWDGDAAIVRAALDCGPNARPSAVLDCTVMAEWPIPALGTTVEEIECGVARR